jgi:hypothetical protein
MGMYNKNLETTFVLYDGSASLLWLCFFFIGDLYCYFFLLATFTVIFFLLATFTVIFQVKTLNMPVLPTE